MGTRAGIQENPRPTFGSGEVNTEGNTNCRMETTTCSASLGAYDSVPVGARGCTPTVWGNSHMVMPVGGVGDGVIHCSTNWGDEVRTNNSAWKKISTIPLTLEDDVRDFLREDGLVRLDLSTAKCNIKKFRRLWLAAYWAVGFLSRLSKMNFNESGVTLALRISCPWDQTVS